MSTSTDAKNVATPDLEADAEMPMDDNNHQAEETAAPAKKTRQTKKHKYLRSLGIVRPPTDFQLWGESVKEELRKDIETGEPPAERLAAYQASLNDKGKCNLNTYRGKLWRSVEAGGFGYVTPEQRDYWQKVYQENRIPWKARQEAAMQDYPRRPPTPYFCFYEKDFINQYLAEHPGTALPVIAKAASKVWDEKKDTPEFKKYYEDSERLKEEYIVKKAAYDARMLAQEQQKQQQQQAESESKPAPKKSAKPKAAFAVKAAADSGPKKAIAKSESVTKASSGKKATTAKTAAKKQMGKTAATLQKKAGAKAAPRKGKKSQAAVENTDVNNEQAQVVEPTAMPMEE